MGVVIRKYKDTDYVACRSLWGELAQHHADIYEDTAIAGDDPGRGLDVFLKRNDRCGFWVAANGEKILGFAGLLSKVGEEGVAEIEPVVVSIKSRRQGIGTQLVQYVSREAGKKGFRFLTIRPELRNEEAFKLYVKLGFNLVGSIELFQDLSPVSERTWQSGIEILGNKLRY